jgi:hypothetical protein
LAHEPSQPATKLRGDELSIYFANFKSAQLFMLNAASRVLVNRGET